MCPAELLLAQGRARPGPVALNLRLPVGSGSEDPQAEGLVHLLEHLVVASVPTRFRHRVRAATGRDVTVFELSASPDEAAQAVRGLLTAVRYPVLGEVAVAREKPVVAQETRERHASTGWRLQQRFLAAWWAGTSWAHSTLGDPAALDDVRAGSLDVVHRQWISAPGAVLAVTGPEEGIRAVRREVRESAGVGGVGRRGDPMTEDGFPGSEWPVALGIFITTWTDSPTGQVMTGVGLADEVAGPATETARDLAQILLEDAGGPHLTTHRLGGVRASWVVRPDVSSRPVGDRQPGPGGGPASDAESARVRPPGAGVASRPERRAGVEVGLTSPSHLVRQPHLASATAPTRWSGRAGTADLPDPGPPSGLVHDLGLALRRAQALLTRSPERLDQARVRHLRRIEPAPADAAWIADLTPAGAGVLDRRALALGVTDVAVRAQLLRWLRRCEAR